MSPVQFLRRFSAHQQASVLIEFAIALPVLILLFYGGTELSRFLLFREKLQSAATQMLDIITQQIEDVSAGQRLTAGMLDNLFGTTHGLMQPYEVPGAVFIVTQVVKPAASCQPVAIWQYRPNPGSRVAPAVGGTVNLDSIQMEAGDSLMTFEIFANYRPLIESVFTDQLIGNLVQYTQVYGHTRYGAFNIDPNSGVSVTAPCIP